MKKLLLCNLVGSDKCFDNIGAQIDELYPFWVILINF